MTSDHTFDGSIPHLYDSYLVPLIFEQYADDLAERTAALAPETVLEIAAGSGVLTRALAPLLPSTSSYTATDLNLPMLEYAAMRQSPESRIDWLQADAMILPFGDATFDIVICQFSVMFLPDRIRGYSEALRVLKPGGSFLFNVWDCIESNVFASAVSGAIAEIFPDDPPQFLDRTPHGYHDPNLIRRELTESGFPEIEITTESRTSCAPTAQHVAIAYCQGTPLRKEIEARSEGLLDDVTDRVATEIEKSLGSGKISGLVRGHVVTARR